MARLSNND